MKIAIFGAGQLAMMMIQADKNSKHDYVVIDPTPKPPASMYAAHIQTEYNNPNTIKDICANYDLVTIDFENVDVSAMKEIEKHIPVHPNSKALEICQDRVKEKELFKSLEIKTAINFKINSMHDIEKCIDSSKGYILKSRRFGYDGKNQYHIRPNKKVETDLILSPCILEELVHFKAEVSLICVKSINGYTFFYPLVENSHRNGILNMSVYPSHYTHLQESAELVGKKLLEKMKYVGVLVIEFFVNENDELIANEMAPRVHNSGHWTIEGSNLSQFEAHIAAITGNIDVIKLELKPSFMFNILSKHISDDKFNKLKANLDIHRHDYHKIQRANRKLGHLTCTAENRESLEVDMRKFKNII
tara:strand:- start:3405 stop:4484 length:1080 start_codon:yes stop_codon:yes gene_type:complete